MWPSNSSKKGSVVPGDTSKDKSSLYDSGRTDSGFLSGGNIVSESLSGEITPPEPSHESDRTAKEDYMRLDSGVDVGLSDQLSELCLSQTPCAEPTNADENAWKLYFEQDDEGDTQLHIAIIQGFIEVVFSLIRMIPDSSYLDLRNDARQTGLHLAVLTNQPQVLRRLVCAGAGLSEVDRNGNTALHLACWAGNAQCVRALVEPVTPSELAACNLSFTPTLTPIRANMYNYEGLTSVHLAAVSGHTGLMKYLVKAGADIDARECKSGRTLLHMAAETGDEKLALLLIREFLADPDVPNYAGQTPYYLARRNPSFVKALVAHGASQDLSYSSDEEDDDDSDQDFQTYGVGFRDLPAGGGIVNAFA